MIVLLHYNFVFTGKKVSHKEKYNFVIDFEIKIYYNFFKSKILEFILIVNQKQTETSGIRNILISKIII